MRLLFLGLLCLLCLIQYPLWWGKGGWHNVSGMRGQLAAQQSTNEGLQARNTALTAEVEDLKSGSEAIEEDARSDLGMIRQGEIFVQILPPGASPDSLRPQAGKELNDQLTDAQYRQMKQTH